MGSLGAGSLPSLGGGWSHLGRCRGTVGSSGLRGLLPSHRLAGGRGGYPHLSVNTEQAPPEHRAGQQSGQRRCPPASHVEQGPWSEGEEWAPWLLPLPSGGKLGGRKGKGRQTSDARGLLVGPPARGDPGSRLGRLMNRLPEEKAQRSRKQGPQRCPPRRERRGGAGTPAQTAALRTCPHAPCHRAPGPPSPRLPATKGTTA